MNLHLKEFVLGAVPALLVAFAAARPCSSAPPVVSVEEVQEMQRRLPNCEACIRAGAYVHVGDAQAVARAVSHAARSRLEAAEAITYGAYESGFQSKARGDLDERGNARALGVWQLHGVSESTAFKPEAAIRIWLGIADASRAACAGNPPGTELAMLASGSCERGKEQVLRRHVIAEKISESK